MRGFLEISQNKLPKRAFRARLPTIFTEKASKTIVSWDASSKFHRTSFQNERFARCFRQFSQKKLPKRSFRARHPGNFTERTSCQRSFRARLPPIFREQASKTSVSHDASDNFHRKSFQNKRFVRGFFKISQNNLPKRAFRARLPPDFIEQSFQNERFVRGFLEISQNKLPKRTFRARLPSNFLEQSFQNERFARCFRQFFCFATVSRHRPTESYERVHPAKAKCASRYNGVPFHISKMYESSAGSPGQHAAYKNHHFTTVSDI